ncbi:MAG TPA: glycosyltransferase family A protein [Longimicrobiales bacterium]|nr:glycosyltransferase family A protein [Longimicrobiales bacterium]
MSTRSTTGAAAALPLVSVITIFHDEARFLGEAIDSVLAQTYGRWELLLCDDGSTDASSQIARSYAEKHPDRIRYLEHPGHANRGMSATRNLGLRAARGALVSFLDGDDVWVPEKLTRQVRLLQQHPEAGAVYGRLHVWHGWTRNPADLARDYVQPLGGPPDSLVHPPELLIRFLRNDVYTPSGLLFRREVLESVGGYEESFRGMHEDGIALAKICLRWPLYASGEVWYKYRQHPDSCCNQEIAAGRDREALRAYLEWIEEYLAAHAPEESEVMAVVRELRRRDERRAGARTGHALRSALRNARSLADRVVPARVRSWIGLMTHGSRFAPPPGWLHLGSLRRVTPVSQYFGFDRGLPIDRHYIERFLAAHRDDIRGRVLEVADAEYTHRFGGERVTHADVLHARPGNPAATLVGDLCTGEGIPDAAFDCIILTQVLPFVWDPAAAIATARRALRPGGVLLVTAPGISQISRHDADRWGDFWRFTSQSLRRLFEQEFAAADVELDTYGNVLAATAFLHGMAAHELRPRELDERHPDYEVTIAVRATRRVEQG